MLGVRQTHDHELVARNLRHAMSSYARSTEQGEVTESPGVVMVNSGVPYSVFNAALLTESITGNLGALTDALNHAERHYERRKMPWSCWTCEDYFDGDLRRDARNLLSQRGLRLVAEHSGMIADSIAAPDRVLPPMEVRRVSDHATRSDFIRVASEVFYLPRGVARRVYDSDRYWEASMVGWVGYVNERPVSTAATDSSAGSVGLYSVATLNGYRKRGYGERITRHALESARRATGFERSILQSTRSGLAMYSRLGYRPLARFLVYVFP